MFSGFTKRKKFTDKPEAVPRDPPEKSLKYMIAHGGVEESMGGDFV